jgi:hypothetical protein
VVDQDKPCLAYFHEDIGESSYLLVLDHQYSLEVPHVCTELASPTTWIQESLN